MKFFKKIIFAFIFLIILFAIAFCVPQGQGKNDRFTIGYDDIQGILQTALSGVTQYTFRQYRTTGVVMPHVAESDVFSLTMQMPHSKQLGSQLKSVHIHYIPVASANGTIQLNSTWGWYNIGDTVPDTLPNISSTTITLATSDQYVLKYSTISINLDPPANEGYSSILYIKCQRVTPSGSNWGASNEIALSYVDGHPAKDRIGSFNEASD